MCAQFARFNPNGTGVGIRISPAFPGERTGETLYAGDDFVFKSTATVTHSHSDGNVYEIVFYELADGRGWIHGFDPEKPQEPQILQLVHTHSFLFFAF